MIRRLTYEFLQFYFFIWHIQRKLTWYIKWSKPTFLLCDDWSGHLKKPWRWTEERQPKVISNHPINSYDLTSPLSISSGTFSNRSYCPIQTGDLDCYFILFYYCCYWELDENDAHIGKFVMPQISLCMELNHTNTLGDPFACQPGNLKALSEFVLALCKIMVQSWVCVWCWFTLSSPTIRNIISPFGAWWARHAEPDWSPGAAGAY